jgi:hypothetical protein
MNALTGTVVSGQLTDCWVRAIRALLTPGVSAISGLLVVTTEFDDEGLPVEDSESRILIDRFLKATFDGQGVETVASTLFPHSFWQPGVPRGRLFNRYKSIFPKLKKYRGNRRGLYFERMTAFDPKVPYEGNQLEFILDSYAKGLRRSSAFQIVLTDPRRDMIPTPRLGFPCLQQIAVNPSESEGTVEVVGFYPTQYVVERGYGNYLGLARLGRFLAHEMKLRLSSVTCVTGKAVLGVTKAELGPLLKQVGELEVRRDPERIPAGPAAPPHPTMTRRRGAKVAH